MLELAILIVVIVLLVTYKASLKYLAKGTSAQVNSWALETEANATEKVSKIKIDKETVSKELCGGPHVKNTSELGHFKIKKEEASSAGVRRIKAILE